MKSEDLHVDLVLNRLTIVKRLENDKHRRKTWECICVCGTTVARTCTSLRLPGYKSCGCYQKELLGRQDHVRWQGIGDIGRTVYSNIKTKAEVRNILFELSHQDIYDLYVLQDRKCALSGVELNICSYHDRENFTASLDRIDSKIGYVKGNVQWVHKWINFMKQDFTQEEFLEFCHLISDHQRSKDS